jgi:NTE family protein
MNTTTERKPLDTVFEGGGARGLVFVGALRVLEEYGYAHRKVIGASAGAIAAALVAAGYSSSEFAAASMERLPDGRAQFAMFRDTPAVNSFEQRDIDGSLTRELLALLRMPLIGEHAASRVVELFLYSPIYRHLFSLLERGGLFAGEGFLSWFRGKLNAGGRHFGDLTLREMFVRTNVHLSVVASDLTEDEMLVLNHYTAPDCPVSWAVRMSVSIPLFWQEVRWRKGWGTYMNRDITDHVIVDGGLMSNFPLDLLVSKDLMYRVYMENAENSPAEILGLYIDSQLPVGAREDDVLSVVADWLARNRLVGRAANLLTSTLQAPINRFLRYNKELICRLPAKGYSMIAFDIPKERIQSLIEGGARAMREYLKQCESCSDTRGLLSPDRRFYNIPGQHGILSHR